MPVKAGQVADVTDVVADAIEFGHNVIKEITSMIETQPDAVASTLRG